MSEIILLKIENGALVPIDTRNAALLKKLSKETGDAVLISYLDQVDTEDKISYLAKVHKSIRVLSGHIGYTFDEMKNVIKKQSGLYTLSEDGIEYKSFAHCTKDELSLAIQACVDLSNRVGANVY